MDVQGVRNQETQSGTESLGAGLRYRNADAGGISHDAYAQLC
jgi:hypothetical protein